MDEFLIEITF